MNYEGFSTVFGEALRKILDDRLMEKASSTNSLGEFDNGYLVALHRVFTLIEQTAEIYGIPLSALDLEGLQEEDFF